MPSWGFRRGRLPTATTGSGGKASPGPQEYAKELFCGLFLRCWAFTWPTLRIQAQIFEHRLPSTRKAKHDSEFSISAVIPRAFSPRRDRKHRMPARSRMCRQKLRHVLRQYLEGHEPIASSYKWSHVSKSVMTQL